MSSMPITHGRMPGAASDKVAALEKAGVIVTNSPALIGAEMLKVRDRVYSVIAAS